MAYDLEEQEKLDQIKAWWDRYGTFCVILAFVALAAVAGWRGWIWYQGHQAGQAMGYFEALESATRQEGEESEARIKAASATLRTDFPKSGYTSRAVLMAAAALQQRGDQEGAKEQLNWLVASKFDPALQAVAQLRLAGLLSEQQHYDQALALLEPAPVGFAALYADRKGDVYFAQGDKQKARQAWQAAVAELENDPLSQVVQLKLDALSGV